MLIIPDFILKSNSLYQIENSYRSIKLTYKYVYILNEINTLKFVNRYRMIYLALYIYMLFIKALVCNLNDAFYLSSKINITKMHFDIKNDVLQ